MSKDSKEIVKIKKEIENLSYEDMMKKLNHLLGLPEDFTPPNQDFLFKED